MNNRLPLTKSLLNSTRDNLKRRSVHYLGFLFLGTAFVFGSLSARQSSAQADRPPAQSAGSKNAHAGGQRPLANLSLVITVPQDGLALMNTTGDTLNGRNICPSDPSPGCDFSEHNNIVRTNDEITYTYQYSVNAGDEPDLTVTAAAPFGSVWKSVLPAFCLLPGSSVNSGDGISTQSVITCRRGPRPGGSTEGLSFAATILGTVLNNTIINASGVVSGGAGSPSSPAFAGAPNVTVSAAPRYNLRKNFFTYSGSDAAGYTIDYTATIEILDDSSPADLDPRIGSSVLPANLTFTDTVSAVSPKASWVSCTLVNSFSAPGPAPGITCSQAGGAGTPITANITNLNTSLNQYTGPQSSFGIAAFRIRVSVSAAEITAGGHTITDVLTGFNPVSPSPANQPNFNPLGENTSDNDESVIVANPPFIPPGTGFFQKNFVREYNNPSPLGFDTFVAPNETFASQVFLNNNTQADLHHVVLCDVIDNSKYSVELIPSSTMAHLSSGQAPTAVEFAAGYVNPATWLPTGNGGNPAGIRSECDDPGIIWKTDPAMVTGGISAVTKFRVRYDSLSPGAVSVRVRVKARDLDPTNQPIPAGTALPNFGIWRSDEQNQLFIDNTFYQSAFPNSPTGTVLFGGRVNLARAIVRISKETENNNMSGSIETGSPVGIGFVLKPTISTIGPPNPVPVTVTDILPPGLHYVGGSSSIPSQPVQTACTGLHVPYADCAVAGQEILTWTLNPNPTPNMPITPITFRAVADLTVLNNQTMTNVAIVASPGDPEPESLRRAVRNVVGAAPSTFLIFKQTGTPQIDVNGNFSYMVTYRNSSVQSDFTGMDFIDILPSGDDATLPFGAGTHIRTPNSVFSGTRTLVTPLTGPAGATWYFTNAPVSAINISPKDSSNLNPGVGGSIWCLGTGGNPTGCPGPITAVRMQDNTPMPRSNAIRSFTLSFSSNGNQANDVYTNNSGGSVNELVLPVSSVNVPVTVRDGKISGVVWYDTNADGIRVPAETGRVGSSLVTLTGPVNGSMMTNASGAYSFNGLPGGAYTVKFTKPINYSVSLQDNPSAGDGVDSDGDPVTLIANVPSLGVAATTVDQGFYQLNLRGTVWNDGNCDGIQGGVGEGAITSPIFDLELLNDQGNVVRKTQTTGGDYVFVNLPAGDYKVRMTTNSIPVSGVFFPNPNDNVDRDNNGMQETPSTLISNTISLAPGTEPDINHANGMTLNKTLDFGLCLTPTAAGVAVGGRVLTADGRGIGKALVTMTGTGGTVHQALTNPFGYYRFDNVAAGTTVLISVSSKSHTFEVGTRVISVSDELLDVNFIAME